MVLLHYYYLFIRFERKLLPTYSMKKTCQKCSESFDCKAEDIKNCQCFEFRIDKKEGEYIQARYSDCLCGNCLIQLKKDYRSQLLNNIKTLLN